MKNIIELSDDEAKEILKFVYPNDANISFIGVSHESKITPEGRERLTFDFRPIIGIEFHNGQDNCVLHFDNSRVVLWLYKNGYDILNFLENNVNHTQELYDFENFAFIVELLSSGEYTLPDGKRDVWTSANVMKTCSYALKKYYYKDNNE